MPDFIVNFFKITSVIDLTYLVVTILSLIKCYKKGFVLSILSMAKWLFAYIITLMIFPSVKPYLKDIIDNEYSNIHILHKKNIMCKEMKLLDNVNQVASQISNNLVNYFSFCYYLDFYDEPNYVDNIALFHD